MGFNPFLHRGTYVYQWILKCVISTKNQYITFVKVFFWKKKHGPIFRKVKSLLWHTPPGTHPLKRRQNLQSFEPCKIFRLIFLNHLLLIESLGIYGSNKHIKVKLSSSKNSKWMIQYDGPRFWFVISWLREIRGCFFKIRHYKGDCFKDLKKY